MDEENTLLQTEGLTISSNVFVNLIALINKFLDCQLTYN